MKLFPILQSFADKLDFASISKNRQEVLATLIDYIHQQLNDGNLVQLNFICTHNSRRSQFSQIWAQTAAAYFGIPAKCYSGGVEVTAFNPRAVASIIRNGFLVDASDDLSNPVYSITFSEENPSIMAFSKVFDNPANPAKGFAAVMTCAHADENCPFIPGADARIPLRYEDPKAFDDSPEEADKYDERSKQIATELFYVFQKIKSDRVIS